MIIKDGDWILFDHDIKTGRQVWRYEHGDGNVTFRTDYPVQEILDTNADHLGVSQNKRFGDWERVASIPLNVFHDSGLSDAASQHDDKYTSRWLNDGDNRKFRTFRGDV